MESNKSSLMLKYQKAKVKLLEYEVPKKEWPSFPLNYRDLAYPTVLTISQCAEAINENLEKKITYRSLRYCSDFYDAAFQSREQMIHDADFALSGATAYFFMDNFGSAKVLWKGVNTDQIMDDAQECLYEVFSLAFTGITKKNTNCVIVQAIVTFWKDGNKDALLQIVNKYRKHIFNSYSPQTWFWGEIVCAVVKVISDASARILLPMYSALDIKNWEAYFERKSSINLLWASQRLVGTSKILQGQNAIVQLPTGVGKTKSIELIIWSMFLAGRGSKALIVAPLRSLCNEITYDMKMAFPKEVSINQFSDVLEDDFIDMLLGNTEKQILVCTPEKLQYIFHHDNAYLQSLDLYIFDESHMFDDRSRGALYELLLTDIKLGLSEKQQLVLMSAVLPNANEIVKWLFGDDGVLAYDANIKSTPKAIGFADKNKQLHYYTPAEDEENFFVPYTYKTQKLKPIGKERKERFFPEDSQDRALYYTNILCKTGGVAIYFPQKRSIPKFFAKLMELDKRGYSLDKIRTASDIDELSRFHTLFKEYYGEDYIYTRTVQHGILPHYSSLPNGIKISTEYAYKKDKIKAVACTSTLAQGVNIPIKYLLITGTNFAATKLSVRNFQNLIGRTGRSGVYTEGDIIVTESKLYDDRRRGRGYYKWQDTKGLFDGTAVEECGSSILNIVRDYAVTYKVQLSGFKIVNYICENIIDNNWINKLLNKLLEEINEIDKSDKVNYYRQDIFKQLCTYKASMDSIENEIIYLLSYHSMVSTVDLLHEISNKLLENTLAFYLATQEEKNLLRQLFDAIESKIEGKIGNIKKYAGPMISMADADKIIEWIKNNNINTGKRIAKDLLDLIENLFGEVYPSLNLKKGFALSWIRGDSYEQMNKEYEIKIYDIEKLCQYNISYQMSFLVGNIIDLVDVECVNIDALKLLQQALRYGVNTRTAISICEKIFNDRFLAKQMTDIIGNNGVSTDEIVTFVKLKKEKMISLLSCYPSYFINVVESI